MGTVLTSPVPPAGAGGLVKVRQIAALSIDYVVDCERQAALVPKVAFAAFVCPRAVLFLPVAILPHPSSRVYFECIERTLRLDCSNRHHNMHMVCSRIEGM